MRFVLIVELTVRKARVDGVAHEERSIGGPPVRPRRPAEVTQCKYEPKHRGHKKQAEHLGKNLETTAKAQCEWASVPPHAHNDVEQKPDGNADQDEGRKSP